VPAIRHTCQLSLPRSKEEITELNAESRSRLFASVFGFCQCNDTRNDTRPERLQRHNERGSSADTSPKKLSYRGRRGLDELPACIDPLETEERALAATIADPLFYKQPAATITAALEQTTAIERELAGPYARWDQLDSRGSE
jgi:hypothetical protein